MAKIFPQPSVVIASSDKCTAIHFTVIDENGQTVFYENYQIVQPPRNYKVSVDMNSIVDKFKDKPGKYTFQISELLKQDDGAVTFGFTNDDMGFEVSEDNQIKEIDKAKERIKQKYNI